MKLKNWLLLASLFSLSSYAQNVQGDMNGDNQITMDDVTLLVDRYVTGNTNAHNACVDLGLSVMWASSNIGATKPEDVGTLFAWGETTTKSSFEVSNYFDTKDSGRTFKKYNEQGPYTLVDEDDAAYVATDGALRMPTQEEWKELYDKCSITSKFISGVRCYKFTGPNGKYITLPFASDMDGSLPGKVAFAYWSSSLDPSRPGFAMMFNGTVCSSQARVLGASVRGVKNVEKPVLISEITLSESYLKLKKGDKSALDGYFRPISANHSTISWKSSDTNVAKVVNGVVTAVGNGICTITVAAEEGGAKATCSVHVGEWLEHNGHEYVDLGTGVKWATMNVGANYPEDTGDFFAWGSTQKQIDYSWVNCKYQTQNTTNWAKSKFTKYVGSTTSGLKDSSATDADALKTVLDREDDAAYRNWGGNWRMPTKAEQDALRSECYWQWVTTYNGKSVNGYIVYKAKSNEDKGKYSFDNPSLSGVYSILDPHIFIPAAGYFNCTEQLNVSLVGNYWSSSLLSTHPERARILTFDSGGIREGANDRCAGQPVRAVCE